MKQNFLEGLKVRRKSQNITGRGRTEEVPTPGVSFRLVNIRTEHSRSSKALGSKT